jgi:hypothetical protein
MDTWLKNVVQHGTAKVVLGTIQPSGVNSACVIFLNSRQIRTASGLLSKPKGEAR